MFKFRERVAKKIMKGVERTLDKAISKVENAPLEEQVKLLRRWMVLPGVKMPDVRKSLLEGLPKDIKKKALNGDSVGTIKAYYWECVEFRDLWTRTLQMEEATLDELIRSSCETEID